MSNKPAVSALCCLSWEAGGERGREIMSNKTMANVFAQTCSKITFTADQTVPNDKTHMMQLSYCPLHCSETRYRGSQSVKAAQQCTSSRLVPGMLTSRPSIRNMYSVTIASRFPSSVSAAMKESISQLDWIPCSFSRLRSSLSSSAHLKQTSSVKQLDAGKA